ncbi:hypothetical protein DPM19_26715 [Actinomadura craniellae]|uniref:Uncharacterized protein n=1 Tax=Actinomadura craniellae TaxID=2231787 RepID=A0A365GZN3_9ACTN|nr:DUF6338 family protein [Actinomadura craniellae]RAY12299.1 hypothetical protein DPM19_26715 [Actinomadura craniellae]
MPQAPTTVMQAVIVMLLVLPGVTYQFVRERSQGISPHHKDLGERILRALVAGIVLDTFYVLLAGNWLVKLIYDRQQGWLSGAANNPRPAALTALLLLVAIPAGAAWTLAWWGRRGSSSAYQATPTAWDETFNNRAHCFVRARLKSGEWVGGWYGERSYASSYPEPPDLYLQTAWAMTKFGRFTNRLEQTDGIYIRIDEVEILDFIRIDQE